MTRKLFANPWRSAGLFAGLALLTSCSESTAPATTTVAVQSTPSATDPAVLTKGQSLYRTHCASCHGAMAQGAPDWHKRGTDGKFPPPPLNGTGHTWHHPHSQLVATIKNGTLIGGGNMPPWKDKLSDAEIDAVLAWLRSNWPPEIHTQWQRMNQAAQSRQRN